jgi:hypothetical protein
MPIDLVTALWKGPQGPELIRAGDDLWGKFWEEAFAGNDDEGVIEKTGILWKHTFGWASMFLIFDTQMFHYKGGIPNILQRAKWHYVPWMGAPLAYTSTVCCVSALRGGKTDQKNHVAGALAAGAVIGKHAKNFQTGLVSGLLLSCLAWYYKDSRMRGYEVFPLGDGPARHGNQFSHKHDYTTSMFTPRPGYWARSQEEVEKVFKQGQMGDGNYNRKIW